MATAPAMAMPMAADFPRPLAAVKATVERNVFSLAASKNVTTAFAWSNVLHCETNGPAGSVSFNDSFKSVKSACSCAACSLVTGAIDLICDEIGKIFNSSSIIAHV